MQQERVLDMPHYRALDEAKIVLFRETIPGWKDKLGLQTAWDVGDGIGRYYALLVELGFFRRANGKLL